MAWYCRTWLCSARLVFTLWVLAGLCKTWLGFARLNLLRIKEVAQLPTVTEKLLPCISSCSPFCYAAGYSQRSCPTCLKRLLGMFALPAPTVSVRLQSMALGYYRRRILGSRLQLAINIIIKHNTILQRSNCTTIETVELNHLCVIAMIKRIMKHDMNKQNSKQCSIDCANLSSIKLIYYVNM